MVDRVRIALAGAGLVGRRHASAIAVAEDVELVAVIDPDVAAQQLAERHRAIWHTALAEVLADASIDGVIVATPNQTHVELALACMETGIPVLVEKPLADTLSGAEHLQQVSEAQGVPLLVGHHRRHNDLMRAARALVDAGELGQITCVQSTTWLYKPEGYFDAAWRRQPGAGPVSINLIHDVDALRYLCGEIASVQAISSNAVRGFEVEDTAAILLRFVSGAVGTMTVSDTTVAPFSWELCARENPMYPTMNESCYHIGGTHGTLSLPALTLWAQPGERNWCEPMSGTNRPVDFEDPLLSQVRHFADVIRGQVTPLVTASDGVANQRVIEAIAESAHTNLLVTLT